MIRVLYFARLREQLGVAAEELGGGLATPGAIIALLSARGGVWQEAFGGGQQVLMAVNREMAHRDTAVMDGDEVAFFPPITGG